MYLKRHYDPDSLEAWQQQRDAAVEARFVELQAHSADVVALHGEEATRKRLQEQFSAQNSLPQVAYIEPLRISNEQVLSVRFVDTGMQEGWLSVVDGKLIIRTAPDEDDLVFRIERRPGKYSCFTGERLGSEKAAKEHVAQFETESPDPNNPSGWRDDRFYSCVRESDHG